MPICVASPRSVTRACCPTTRRRSATCRTTGGVGPGSKCARPRASRTPTSTICARPQRRLNPFGWRTNAEVPGIALRLDLPQPIGVELLDQQLQQGQLSARGVDNVLRLAWTIADLAQADRPNQEHLDQALALHGRAAVNVQS